MSKVRILFQSYLSPGLTMSEEVDMLKVLSEFQSYLSPGLTRRRHSPYPLLFHFNPTLVRV